MVSHPFQNDAQLDGPFRTGAPSTRLRNKVASPIVKGEEFARNDHVQQRGSYQGQNVRGTLESSVRKVGWRAAVGLVVLCLFLLLSSGSNRYDYASPPSYLSSSSSTYKTAATPMERVFAKCNRDGIHAIPCKVEHAAQLASQLRSRQSTTVKQAVLAYKRRYLRAPPSSFERWVELALEHNSTIIDDYDQLEIDLSAFRSAGLVGDKLKSRMLEAKSALPGLDFGHLSVVDGQAVAFGPVLGTLYASALVDFLKPVQHLIPDVTIPVNWFAEPRVPHPDPLASSRALEAIPHSREDPTKILQQACPSNHISPIRAWDLLEPPLDYCQEDVDELKELHGFLQAPGSFFPLNKLVPIISRSKLSNFADILAPNVCYGNGEYRGEPDTTPWQEKKDSLYWRGTTTGVMQTPQTWARGHRHRMVRYVKQLREAANKLTTGIELDPFDAIYGGNRTIAHSRDSVHVAGNTLPLFDYTDEQVAGAVKRLGAETFDVAWSNIELADDETLASINAHHVVTGREDSKASYRHKFLLDLDGQSMSCRFYQLLASNSVVFKQTIWSEYHDDRLVPWIHYVPLDLRVQNNELPMLLDFFINHPQGPATASKIAAASREWTETTLRPIDAALYYARVLIEYAELYRQM